MDLSSLDIVGQARRFGKFDDQDCVPGAKAGRAFYLKNRTLPKRRFRSCQPRIPIPLTEKAAVGQLAGRRHWMSIVTMNVLSTLTLRDC
jgi:hypothetical protein